LGDLETSQETVQFKLDYTSVKSEIITLPNQFKAGLDFSLINGQYDRPETSYFYSSDFVPASSFTCLPGDVACVENEQYLRRREEFQSTAIDVNLNTFDLFAEDTIWLDRLQLRFGVRYSYDDLMKNNNVAPRLTGNYDIIGNGQTVLLAGWNRYYDQTLLTYALREAFSPTPIRVERTDQTISFDFDPDPSTLPNLTIRPGNQEYHFSKLKSPYVDEVVAGLKQFIFGGELDLRYVYRKYEDQFARERERISGVSHYELNNNGSRRYQSVRASWNRVWPIQALEVNATWQETESTNEEYGVTFDDDDLTEKVLYNGEFMYKHELPREDFNRNWVANLHYTAKISTDFKFINFTKYRSGYRDLDITSGSPKFIIDPIDGLIFIYEKVKRPSSIVFDWILEWTPPISEQRNFMISFEAYNVFDKKVSVGEEDDEYELGRQFRQFWLGAEYRF
jgi:hypothetical protein